jgi:hypothetical protein
MVIFSNINILFLIKTLKIYIYMISWFSISYNDTIFNSNTWDLDENSNWWAFLVYLIRNSGGQSPMITILVITPGYLNAC